MRKRRQISALFITAWTCLGALKAGAAPPVDWTTVYEKAKPSIPMIVTHGAVCSGALVSPTLILTAGHCVWTLRRVSVTWPDDLGNYTDVDVIALDRKGDLAVLRLPAPVNRRPLVLWPSDVPLKEGSAVATIGHPSVPEFWSNPPVDREMVYLISTGVISGVTKKDFISDLSLSPGNSGGPALDPEGRILGVASRKRVDRFVGNIGFISGPRKAREIVEGAEKVAPGKQLSLFQAHNSLGFGLEFGFHSLIEKLRPQDNELFAFSARLDMFDRLRVLYTIDFFKTNIFYSAAGLGWKFPIGLPNRTAIWLIPTGERVSYDFDTQDGANFTTSVWAGALEVGLSGFPLRFKLSLFDFEDQTETIAAIQASTSF